MLELKSNFKVDKLLHGVILLTKKTKKGKHVKHRSRACSRSVNLFTDLCIHSFDSTNVDNHD